MVASHVLSEIWLLPAARCLLLVFVLFVFLLCLVGVHSVPPMLVLLRRPLLQPSRRRQDVSSLVLPVVCLCLLCFLFYQYMFNFPLDVARLMGFMALLCFYTVFVFYYYSMICNSWFLFSCARLCSAVSGVCMSSCSVKASIACANVAGSWLISWAGACLFPSSMPFCS